LTDSGTAILIAMTVPFTTVNSSSALISLRLASRGGTPTPTTTTTTYDYSYYDYGPAYDYQYWNDLAVSVQSELEQRGYYQGAIDGVIGSASHEAIRAFQAAQRLPVTGVIDRRVLTALEISYKSA
jgi:putative peptidoglycan binding protein